MVSSIYTAQHNGFMSDVWKFNSSLSFTFSTSVYVVFLFLVANRILMPDALNFLYLEIMPGRFNLLFNLLLYVAAPINVANYFLFFRNKRYKQLIKVYATSYNKRLFVWFFVFSYVCLFASLFIKRN